MSAVIYYKQDIVGEQIECECGYESDYVDYDYSSDTTDVRKPWTCPSCGKTFDLEEDFI